jgi:secreted PhoX family phosphatase
MALEGTSQNCGGGKTYWGTWVTCEEDGSRGQVWEVDPNLGANSQRNQPTVLGGDGGNYESFAYDARDRLNPTFYVTHDSSNGALVRFTPNADVVRDAEESGDYSNVLTTMGTLEWLMLNPVSGNANALSGTFSWTSNRSEADSNSNSFYRYSEGIDVRNGFVYFTTKKTKSLYILDLDNLTYERSSTVSGAFDGQPDQIKRIISNDPENDMLYFCEEASSDNGIHARDSEGNFYTIIDSDMLNSETTG